MITFKQFTGIDDDTRYRLFRDNAVLVGKRSDNEYTYDLFQLFGFYIEAKFALYTEIAEGYTVFDNTDKLAPYLCELDIVSMLATPK